jgi:hypothetical protein
VAYLIKHFGTLLFLSFPGLGIEPGIFFSFSFNFSHLTTEQGILKGELLLYHCPPV